MPVTVHIPTRIRIDLEAATQHPEWIAAAVESAVSRALVQSKREVIDPRGGYYGVNLARPQFSWSGEDLDRLPVRTRRALEEQVARIITEAAERSGVLDAARAAEEGGPPLSGRVHEPFNARSYSRLLNVYSIPSYDGGEAHVTLGEPTFGEVVMHLWMELTESRFTSQTPEQWFALAQQSWGELPTAVPRGFVFPTNVGWAVHILAGSGWTFSFASFQRVEVEGTDQSADVVFHADDPAPGPGTAVRTLVQHNLDAIRAIYETHFGQLLFNLISRAASPTLRPRMTVEEFNQFVNDAVARRLDAMAQTCIDHYDQAGLTITSVVLVRVGAHRTLVWLPDPPNPITWTGSANLLPLTEVDPGAGMGGGSETPGEGEGGERSGAGGEGATGRGTGGGGSEEAGTGEGSGTGAGDGTGSSTGTGTGGSARRRGGFVYDPSASRAEPGEPGALFPPAIGGGDITLTCEPLEGEVSVDELGADGEALWRVIEDIAYRLQIPPCRYPAHFCVNAATAIGGRAQGISLHISQHEPSGFTRPVESSGNVGTRIDFHPVASPSIQFLRHLAGVVPRVAGLMRRLLSLYEQPEHRGKITGTWAGNIAAWQLHFLHAFTPAMRDSVGHIFISTCQAMLMQLLQASKQGIDQRIERFNDYAPIFERLLVSQLTQYTELDNLRNRLRANEFAQTVFSATDAVGGDITATIAAANPATAWFTAARALSGAFLTADRATHGVGGTYEVVRGDDGVARIRDSHGMLWSMQDIEQAMVMQRGLAEGIDPLVKQMTELPGLMMRFRLNRSAIRDELWRVLNEMRSNNAEMTERTREKAMYALRATTIQEHIPSATIPGTSYALQGIHLQAHQQIGEFFLGDSYYGVGVDYLFSAELGRESLLNIALTLEIIALSVMCPPLGFAVGIAVSAVDVARAHERERLFESLIDPELVLTRAEVEMELFAAYLGLALSIVPEAGTVVGAVGRGGRVALRATLRSGLRTGLRRGARAASRYVVRRVTRQIIEAASRDLLEAFVREVVTNAVMDQVIRKVMEPILAYVEREAQIRESVGGPEGARLILSILGTEGGGSGHTMGRHGGVQ